MERTKKVRLVKSLIQEWGLSEKERKKLIPADASDRDYGAVLALKKHFSVNHFAVNGIRLHREAQRACQATWLRTPKPELKGKSPLDFVGGNSNRLTELAWIFALPHLR